MCKGVKKNIYYDSQNVNDSNIQQSLSVILKDEPFFIENIIQFECFLIMMF